MKKKKPKWWIVIVGCKDYTMGHLYNCTIRAWSWEHARTVALDGYEWDIIGAWGPFSKEPPHVFAHIPAESELRVIDATKESEDK